MGIAVSATCAAIESWDQRLEAIHAHMYESIGSYYILDHNRQVLYANKEQAEKLCFSSIDDLIGRTMKQTINERFEPVCFRNDKMVKSSRAAQIFTECAINVNNKLRVVSSHKRPFYHKGKLIGIEGISLDIDLSLFTASNQLTEHTVFVDIIDNKIINLTSAQRRVFFYALKGLTAEAIANKLYLSKRTVQNHLACIKSNSHYASLKELVLNTIAL